MKRFLSQDSGNMSLLFALTFSLFGVLGAFSIDSASLYYERRMLQSVVDLAAISAARAPADADAIVRSVFEEAGIRTNPSLVVEVGNFRPLPQLEVAKRFSPNGLPNNAVRVSFEQPGTLYFGRAITEPPIIGASGLAAVTPEVSFSIGSRLASLHAGIANAVLSSLLGTTISLSALDYNGLASTDVNALSFLDALNQELELDVGTYDEVLDAEASAGAIAAALASLSTGAEKSILTGISRAGKGASVPLGDLLDPGRYSRLSVGSGAAVLGVELSLLDILSAAAAVAEGTKQVDLGLGGSIPGVASLKVDLFIGEPAQRGEWMTVGGVGSVVRTAQLRLRINAEVLGGLVLQSALVKLPLWLAVAQSEARLAGATCPGTAHPNGTAEIEVLPGVLRMAVGRLSTSQIRNFGAPLPLSPERILDAMLLRINAAGQVRVGQTQPVTLNFSSSDIGDGRYKTARTATVVSSLTQSLLDELELDISVLGIGLAPVPVLAKAVKTVLQPLVTPLDLVVDTLLTALGVGIGEADVRVYGVRCTNSVLVG